jgi:O-acetyl-ADP-ribose deacetylase (regulator of RNase III)
MRGCQRCSPRSEYAEWPPASLSGARSVFAFIVVVLGIVTTNGWFAVGVYLDGRLEISKLDITRVVVDMIVNAANAGLCGGGGVDGAIHRAAGPDLLAVCRTLGGARTGDVKVTAGYLLSARFIAHAVGPVWQGGEHGEDEQLASCYRLSLEHLAERGLSTVAFPSISTGAYRFPIERAARIALGTVREGLGRFPGIEKVVFCCFSDADLRIYEKSAGALFAGEL